MMSDLITAAERDEATRQETAAMRRASAATAAADDAEN